VPPPAAPPAPSARGPAPAAPLPRAELIFAPNDPLFVGNSFELDVFALGAAKAPNAPRRLAKMPGKDPRNPALAMLRNKEPAVQVFVPPPPPMAALALALGSAVPPPPPAMPPARAAARALALERYKVKRRKRQAADLMTKPAADALPGSTATSAETRKRKPGSASHRKRVKGRFVRSTVGFFSASAFA
jgi:hypothetical protein